MSEVEVQPAAEGLVINPKIRCRYTALQDPKDLHPHPNNPNVHPPKQIEMFIAILGFSGWRRPITVSTRSNFVTKGHGALEAALAAGYTEVPVEYQDYDSDEQELSDIVADNTLQRMSEMNTGKLQGLLVKLNTGEFNMEMTGLEMPKLEKLLGVSKAPEFRLSADGETLAGAPVEPGKEYVEVPEAPGDSESPYAGQGAPAPGVETRIASSQVRMIQLFFTEESLAEFMEIEAFFQAEFGLDNVTDTVLEVLRQAKAGYGEGDA